jgi:hypothetical protein
VTLVVHTKLISSIAAETAWAWREHWWLACYSSPEPMTETEANLSAV